MNEGREGWEFLWSKDQWSQNKKKKKKAGGWGVEKKSTEVKGEISSVCILMPTKSLF